MMKGKTHDMFSKSEMTTKEYKAMGGKKKARSKDEEQIQIAACRYLTMRYPDVIYQCDLVSGMKLTIGQAVKAKRLRSPGAFPDLFIAEPCGGYAGLYIELKCDDQSPFLNNGELSKDAHVKEQSDMLGRLWEKGYVAVFGVGIEQTIKMIDSYLAGEIVKTSGNIICKSAGY
jgi:hypothetical protein